MLNSSSLDTDDRWAWKRPCSFICWRWLPQVFASAFVIASFQSSNLKKEKIERHGFIHAITAHLFLTSKFKSMVKKKRKKTKGNEYRYCRRQPTTTFNLNGHTIEYISEAQVCSKGGQRYPTFERPGPQLHDRYQQKNVELRKLCAWSVACGVERTITSCKNARDTVILWLNWPSAHDLVFVIPLLPLLKLLECKTMLKT